MTKRLKELFQFVFSTGNGLLNNPSSAGRSLEILTQKSGCCLLMNSGKEEKSVVACC